MSKLSGDCNVLLVCMVVDRCCDFLEVFVLGTIHSHVIICAIFSVRVSSFAILFFGFIICRPGFLEPVFMLRASHYEVLWPIKLIGVPLCFTQLKRCMV